MKRILLLILLALPALACGLSTGSTPPTALPTAPAPPIPIVGVNPVSGQPGQSVIVMAAGFPPGARVNLYLSPQNLPSTVPLTTLTTDGNGGLSFAVQLPGQINNTPVTANMAIVFTLSVESGGTTASALFLAAGGSGIVATAIPAAGGTGGGTGGATLFITAPGLSSVLMGSTVTVTGSGSASDNRVIVQIQDSNNQVLGSTTATIQAVAGSIGVWQATVSFNQPAAPANGYIVALTNAEQASIPITFAGVAPITG